MAFDDVSLRLAGGGDNLAPNPSFEDEGAGWSERQDARFPATSLHWGTSGTAEPDSGSHAYALSNQAHGYLESEPIAVAAGTAYSLTVWLRGELDPDDSHGKWKVWARFYEAGGGYLSKEVVASGEPAA